MLQVARLAPRALDDAATRVQAFFERHLNDDGGGRDRSGKSDLYYTVFVLEGLLALQAELPVARTAQYLETFGAGNAPDRGDDLIGALRDASDRGVVIVNVTQCLRGRVRPTYTSGHALVDAGVVPGADMTPEAALAKLAFLLAQPLEADEVRALAGRSLRGELTEEPVSP